MSGFFGLALLLVVGAGAAAIASVAASRGRSLRRRLVDAEASSRRETARRTVLEERVRELTHALDDAYEHAPYGRHALDPDGVFLAINRTELEMLGFERAEVVGKLKFSDILTEPSKQRFAREFPRFKRHGRIEDAHFDMVRKDGSVLPVLLSATAIHDDAGNYVGSESTVLVDRHRKVPEDSLQRAYLDLEQRVEERTAELSAVVATLREEIEERERAEELLRQSEERARAVVDAALDGIVTIDDHGAVETLNPAAEHIFGWKESELAGRNVSLLMPEPHASEHDGYLARYRTSAGRNVIGSRRELVGLRRDGTSFPMEIAISEMHLGPRRLFQGTIRDLTEVKRAAERMAQLQEQVRRHEVLATIGTLVAGFAHEARNPLFGISAVLDAFVARFGDREEYRDHLALLRRDVSRLNDLMHDLLELGRPTAELHEEPLRTVIEDAIGQCRALSEQRGVAIEARLPALDLRVRGNDRLVRAFQNLLQNAIQFSPCGGIVRLETESVNGGDRPVVECRVRDCGPGVRAEDLPRLFEPFFSRRPGGTGLGLAIVQRIVEEHGGSIDAANQPEGGAVVTLRLPLAA
jgi:PAS domain S-box-containing protein